jgi:hypothetical protein
MAFVSADIVEMPDDSSVGAMPPYRLLHGWLTDEVSGLSDDQFDFDDTHPDREWMWWSIRRQISHIAWDSLMLPWRRCGDLLWPNGDVPEPIVWSDHQLGPKAKWDRVLDEIKFWEVSDLLAKLDLGLSWLERVVAEQSIETLRATTKTVTATHFWAYVITTLPRGAVQHADDPGSITYDLEGTLWMGFYEMLTHIRTVQRLKIAQGLEPAVELPRVGYLRLPEYWGDTEAGGPSMDRLR